MLNALKCKFMQPMERLLMDENKIIFPRIKVTINGQDSSFSNFVSPQELVDIHKSFLEKLREATQVNPRIKLSKVFIEFREKFLIYGDYCSKMTEATDTLRDVCKRSVAIEQLVAVSNLRSIFDGDENNPLFAL